MRPEPLRRGSATLVAVIALLAAAPTLAQSLEDRFIAVVAAEGCKITETAAKVILPRHGITMDETEPLVDDMIKRGVAEFDGKTLTLSDRICTPKPSDRKLGPREVLLRDAIRKTGCAMTENQAEAILPGLGMEMEEAEDIADLWIERGMASFENDKLVLKPELCRAGRKKPKGKEKTETPPPTQTDAEAVLLRAFRENGCRMTEKDAERALPGLGIEMRVADDILEGWARRKLAWLEGEYAVIAPGLCGAHNLDKDDFEGRLEALVAVIKLNGCRMTESEAEKALPAAGFDKAEVGKMVERLVAEGRARQERSSLELIGGGC